MKKYHDEDEDDALEEDTGYSPLDWERDPFESDEDYKDRMQDMEDWLEYLDK